ncbi:MAG: TetR/AcrR family transcriptional regulator C-terminal domain-containing protein [Pygmaiobacter sp.]|nr:TetR/AcrR family transcriptional regulator C-terminal domain-containing protein [Pygmaiobacter sp.]
MPGSNNTKMALAHSLQELMTTMPLEKISVSDIVDHVGMGRNTFYYHFEDKYDLVNWYFQTEMTHFLTTGIGLGSWQRVLTGVEEYFRANRVFYTKALAYTGQNSLRSFIFEFIRDIFMQRALECNLPEQEGVSAADIHFAGTFLAGALMGVIMQWVEGGMALHIADYTDCVNKIMNGRLFSTFFGSRENEWAALPPPDTEN